MSFTNKVVVITGGSEGIGKALVDNFIALGAKVATCGRNFDKLYLLQKLHVGKHLLIYTADVSEAEESKAFIDTVISNFGKIDILINNAGISMRASVEEVELKALRKVVDINFWGTVNCTKFALPYIIESKGTVVGVSSIAGYRGLPGRSGYSASKYAIHGFLEALRTEMLHKGVNVMWVCPGYTSSNIRNAAITKDGSIQGESPLDEAKLMTADACSKHIIKAIAKRKRTLVLTLTGWKTVILNKIFPSLADKLTHKFFYKNGELVK